MSIHDLPTLLTDVYRPRDPQWLWDRGWRVILRQAQNVTNPYEDSSLVQLKDGSLDPGFRKVGFKTGVWGVTYRQQDFYRDAYALAERARYYAADVVQMDAEEGLKNSDTAGIIHGLSSYLGPKALNTLGAATGDNVFPIDYRSFINAGWDIVLQAYANIDPAYEPWHCVYHAQRAGIPLDRAHLMIELGDEGSNPLSGAQWVERWKYAKILTNDISVFMAELGTDQDYIDLEAVTLRVEQPATEKPDPTDTKAMLAEIRRLAELQETRWRKLGIPEAKIDRLKIGAIGDIARLVGPTWDERSAAVVAAIHGVKP